MNKFKYFLILLTGILAIVSCNKDDDDDIKIEPLRDYALQNETDKATIESFLNTHYIVITESREAVEDMDVVISLIDNPASQTPIMSYEANVGTATYPQLKSKIVDLHGINYKLYYLVLREGIGESPLNVDNILSSYSGSYLSNVEKKDNIPAYISTTFFEQVKYPQTFMDLGGVVRGWSETFPEFKTGKTIVNSNGTSTYTDFGAGVMFLPSGLAYYSGTSTIPAYRPLVFSFKLYQLQRLDHDGDGVLDINEDIDGDGFVHDYRNVILYPKSLENPDDTDKDGIPDFLDIDDDGDGFTTRLEITKPADKVGVVIENGEEVNYGPSKYFPFEKFEVVDDPTTPNTNEKLNSEPRGIPAFAATGNPDYTSAGRVRLHVDKDHHKATP